MRRGMAKRTHAAEGVFCGVGSLCFVVMWGPGGAHFTVMR